MIILGGLGGLIHWIFWPIHWIFSLGFWLDWLDFGCIGWIYPVDLISNPLEYFEKNHAAREHMQHAYILRMPLSKNIYI